VKTQKKVKTYSMITMLVTLLSCNGFTQENRTPTIVKTFDLDQPGTLNAKSSGGGVTANNQNGDVHLSSSGGGIDATIKNGDDLGLDLDLSSDKVNIELHNFSGRVEKNRVKGTLNGGGIPVYMHSSGGNVTVRFEDLKC
jgi:hypothetical protein